MDRGGQDYAEEKAKNSPYPNLAVRAKTWPTPAVRDYKGANGEEHLEASTGSLHMDQLPNFVEHLWRTPSVTDDRRGVHPDPDKKAGEFSLGTQADRWATPTAHPRSHDPRDVDHGEQLANQADRWPTPTVASGDGGPDFAKEDRSSTGMALPATAARWATPSAGLHNDGESPENFDVRQTKMRERAGHGNGIGEPLTVQAQRWQTPRVAEGPYTRDKGNPEDPRLTLEGQAGTWPTPTSLSSGESRQTGNSASHNETMERAAMLRGSLSSPQAQAPSTTGGEPSPPRRRLNPLFVEWLMGWPSGWTALAGPTREERAAFLTMEAGLPSPSGTASTGFVCSAEGLSLFKRRMRSELLRIALPPEVPLVQTDLFA